MEDLIKNSQKFKSLKRECLSATRLSLTGITNLVVNYENRYIVDTFLKYCFKSEELYKGTFGIDAVELQQGGPGRGLSPTYIDTLIYGTFKMKQSADDPLPMPVIDPETGKRVRNHDGFVNRKEVLTNDCKDLLLVIRNIDYCVDFCSENPGRVDPRSLWIFDNFRNSDVKKRCRLLLVTNEPLDLPFKVRVINLPPVDEFEAQHLIQQFTKRYEDSGYEIGFNENQIKQMVRKLCGSTYTEAGDALTEAISRSNADPSNKTKKIDSTKAVRNLREKINRNLMEEAVGLTHLSPRPWGDYICPESSNFTHDVRKIVRDFEEIQRLKGQLDQQIKQRVDDTTTLNDIEAIQSRMPHVIVLYGKGGVGKSAFPIHFAGLLDFDVWDFNVGASHSKWVGEGAERMRKAIDKISKASHVVIRIDEYDRAIGASHNSGDGMHAAHKQVESEFMNWLQNSQEDNLFQKNNLFLVLTTNHKENITGPLLRSGRADLVIDIDNFDKKSMEETFLSAPRRMNNRGVKVVGFEGMAHFLKAIEELDVSRIADIASQKNFTVRDVDTLLTEMAAHDYYHKQSKYGIPWSTESFVKVLENSMGSAKDDNTCELVLGDRHLME